MIGKSMDKLLFKGKRGQLCAPLFIFLPHMGRNVPIVLPTPTITNCHQLPPTFTNSHQLRLAKCGLPGRTRQKLTEADST